MNEEQNEPVAWQGREKYIDEGEWGRWRYIESCDLMTWQRWIMESPERFEIRPLYSAPRPAPKVLAEPTADGGSISRAINNS